MKKLILIFFALVIFSCGGSTSEKAGSGNVLQDLTFTVDTVRIHSNDEFIFLQWGLLGSAVTRDLQRLYNFNPKDSQLELIDLESRKLLKKVSLEREGPLGTGDSQLIQLDQKGNVYFIGLWELRIFNPFLDSMTLIKLNPDTLSDLEPEDMLGSEALVTADGKSFISTYYSKEQSQAGMLVISLADLSAKKYPFDLGKKVEPFRFTLLEGGQVRASAIERIFLTEVDRKVLVSSTHFNEVYILDLLQDTVMVKTHHSELTANEKKKPEKSTAESFKELEDIMAETEKQVRFGSYVYDPPQKQVWRFSRVLESELEGKKTYKNVVTLFDMDLNQLGETTLPIFPEIPFFFKDGKLWSYVNVEDELGFAVMDFKF